MSRVGIYDGRKYTFTHHNPQTGNYWTDEIGHGMWIDSKKINFNIEPKKSKFKRSGRKSRA